MNVTYNNLEHAKVRIDEFGKVFFKATEPGIYKLKFEYKTPRGMVVKRVTVGVKVYTIKDFTKQPVKASTKGARFAYYWKPSTERKYFGRRFSENISEPYEIYRILFCDGKHWVQTKISGKSAYIPFEHADKEAVEKALGGEWIYMFRGNQMAVNISQGYHANHKGLDITNKTTTTDSAASGLTVYSVGSGTVLYSGLYFGAGYMVAIKLDNGYTVRYLHLNSKLLVEKDQRVHFTTPLGFVSGTGVDGSMQYPVHLHFDVNNIDTYNGGIFTLSNTFDPLTFFPNTKFTFLG
ncbi:MAG: M23 family metallopeptidase [Oscillospiraceae bacterium]|nr:M23 family metallopeptidase [Oscillospiraceae bacterium]